MPSQDTVFLKMMLFAVIHDRFGCLVTCKRGCRVAVEFGFNQVRPNLVGACFIWDSHHEAFVPNSFPQFSRTGFQVLMPAGRKGDGGCLSFKCYFFLLSAFMFFSKSFWERPSQFTNTFGKGQTTKQFSKVPCDLGGYTSSSFNPRLALFFQPKKPWASFLRLVPCRRSVSRPDKLVDWKSASLRSGVPRMRRMATLGSPLSWVMGCYGSKSST